MNEDRNISGKLRELRRARGLTVDTLAKKIGENSQKVGRIERGTRSITLDYLVRVSEALETPVESFLGKEITEKPQEFSTSNSTILSNIVLLVEEYDQKSSIESQKKALIISKMYELALKFPEASRQMFIHSLLEFIECLDI